MGSVRGAEALDRVARGESREHNLALVEEICDTMTHASLCGLGGMAPAPVLSAMKHFAEDFRRPPPGG
jgi:formate dehydrogenase iron-sulfur subunit